MVIKQRLSEKYCNLFFLLDFSGVLKLLTSSSRLCEPAQCWRLWEWDGGSLALHPWGLTRNHLWGAGEGWSLSNEPPSPSSFSPNELGTFHCQLFAWVLPFQLAKENWQARLGFSMDFKDILLQIKKKRTLFEWFLSLLNQIEDYFIITVCNQSIYNIFRYISCFVLYRVVRYKGVVPTGCGSI